MEEIFDQNDDSFCESPSGSVKLSHLNTKSSVLCLKSQNITGQYLALQQLDAHKRMVERARGTIDRSAPRSLQSYLSVIDRQKKRLWYQTPTQSKSLSHNLNETFTNSNSASKLQVPFSEEDDNISLNGSSVSKAVQTCTPFVTVSSKTDDKISWYLEALSQGELLAPPFVYMKDSGSFSQQSGRNSSTSKTRKKCINGDILETHVNCFVKSKKPFSPRLTANIPVKSKVKEMRCYNPPFRRKKQNSTNSSDTFESYEQDEDSEKEVKEEDFNNSFEDIETQINKKPYNEKSFDTNARLQDYLLHQSREKYETGYPTDNFDRNEEDKYLDFLSKVTEDILRSGVYSDRAIQQAFEFHMQFYAEQDNKEKLQSLLSQVLEGLKISNDDSDEVLTKESHLLIPSSRPSTPPEKEITSALHHVTDFFKGDETANGYHCSSHSAILSEEFSSNKNAPRKNDSTFRLPDS